MQSEQEFARVAAVRLGPKTGHGIYGYDERGAIRLPSPAMAGLNPGSADGARPRPALLVAGQKPASDMLLFSGVAHVGYLPGERILGLSKLARLVGTDPRSRAEFFALARVPTSPEPM